MRPTSLIGLPFYTLAKYHGMGHAVTALRELRIAKTIEQNSESFRDLGDVRLSAITEDSGSPNLRNFTEFLEDTDRVIRGASKVGPDDFVFCLGGECTFIVGTIAGMKNRFKGKPGVLWIDAHGDFNTPETTLSGFIGGMCLAFACGRGPRLTPSIEGARPLLDEGNVVHLGSRALDPEEAKAMSASRMHLFPASAARTNGISRIASEAAKYLADRSDWIICHLDVDAIDPTVIGAVNYPEAGGLTLEDVKTVVLKLKETEKLRVFDLAAYNASLDKDQTSGKTLVKLVEEVVSTR